MVDHDVSGRRVPRSLVNCRDDTAKHGMESPVPGGYHLFDACDVRNTMKKDTLRNVGHRERDKDKKLSLERRW